MRYRLEAPRAMDCASTDLKAITEHLKAPQRAEEE
jgi:hypothetical protein